MSHSDNHFRDLEQSIATAWEAALSGHGAEVLQAAHEDAQRAAQFIIHQDRDGRRTDLEDDLASALDRLEKGAVTFLRESTLDARRTGRCLALLRAHGRLLRRVARAVEGRAAWDETPYLLMEAQEIENSLRSSPLTEEEASVDDNSGLTVDVRRELNALRFSVIRSHAEHQFEAASELKAASSSNAAEIFLLYRELEATRRQLRSQRGKGGETQEHGLVQTLTQVEDEATRLEILFFRFCESASTDEERVVITDAARNLTGELDEARLKVIDSTDAESIEDLKRLQGVGERLNRAASAALRPSRDRTEEDSSRRIKERRALRRLARQIRRMKAAIADQILAYRMNRLFGRRAVQIWETFVFWLIMAVVALIVIDHHSDPLPVGEIRWTIWVDTVICVFLLTDFFVRLTLSPRRIAYFRRRFLTEFLPSIPFGMLANLEHVSMFQSVRLLRLTRLFRVLRVVRPIIRVVRLMLFVARAADRLVERYAWLLNVNIVFFTDPVKDEEIPTLLKRARDLDSWIARSVADALRELPRETLTGAATLRAGFIESELSLDQGGSFRAVRQLRRKTGKVREIDVDEVIRQLRELNGHRIAEFMGLDFARQVTSSLRLFRLPLLRRLPIVRFVLGPTGVPDPLRTTARLGRVMGDFLALVQRVVTWFADLYGSITGAQFLDRVGMQLIKSTARPARRLVIFGVLLGIAMILVKATRFEFLDAVATALLKFLSFPVLILGAFCFIPLMLGIWFRRIAGQAADFFSRVAEAQFLALTETTKEERAREYLEHLARRVVLPEVRLHHGTDEMLDEMLVDRFCGLGLHDPMSAGGSGESRDERWRGWSHCENVLLFYRAFLDGAFFHRSDTQIASLVVGNLTLENVRRNRLRYSKKDMKRLERLDIGRGKGGVTGPFLWFNFITHSVAQLTARLIIEYNQHCIPLVDLPGADTVDRELFEQWMDKRVRLSQLREVDQDRHQTEQLAVSGADGTLLYRTTEFNALHFLTQSEARDESIRRRFGDLVYQLMREDRENLIRVIFGSYPMQEVPKEKRTLNPYQFYGRCFSRGKVFLAPLLALWIAGRLSFLLLKRIVLIVRDVIDPDSRPLQVVVGRASFNVARRKIHRMRRPAVLEAMRLRAEFDVLYLGLSLPGRKAETIQENLVADDLRLLNASELEWEEFRELKSHRHHQMRVLARILRVVRRTGRDLETEILEANPGIARQPDEALRAVATAFVCDHGSAWSIALAHDELRAILARVKREHRAGKRRFLTLFRHRKLLKKIQSCWPLLTGDRTSPETVLETQHAFLDILVRSGPDKRRHVDSLVEQLPAGRDPYLHAFETLLEVGEQPTAWSEQIVAVRTVQSLGMLDLDGYERLIRTLGNYEEDDVASKRRVGSQSRPHL